VEIGYLLLTVISALGLVIGFIISKYTQEEMSAGLPYLLLLRESLFVIITFFALLPYSLILSIGASISAALLLVFFHFVLKKTDLTPLFYFFLGLAFFLNRNPLIPALIFLYGLPAGSVTKSSALWFALPIFLVAALLPVFL